MSAGKPEKSAPDVVDFLLSLPERLAYVVMWAAILVSDTAAKLAGKDLPNRPQKK